MVTLQEDLCVVRTDNAGFVLLKHQELQCLLSSLSINGYEKEDRQRK